MPFLYRNIDEIDYVRKRLMPEIEQGFRDNGYVLLGWMEIGDVYLFSQYPIASLEDLDPVIYALDNRNYSGGQIGVGYQEAE